MNNRGLTRDQAIKYLGVKRRVFDAHIRQKLTCRRLGTCLIFDRLELDRVFERLMRNGLAESALEPDSTDQTADANTVEKMDNGSGTERPIPRIGVTEWAKKHGASTPTMDRGKSTSTGGAPAFASAVSKVLQKRNSG